MNQADKKKFYYSATYKLDKAHFSETFDESTPAKIQINDYFKALFLALLGFSILYFTKLSSYAAWFIVILGAVEALSVYFRKPWWLARQMISQAANTELTLTIDEVGISSKSRVLESQILWDDIRTIEQTKQGWLLLHPAGKNYVSNRCLSKEAKAFLKAKKDAR